MSPKTNPYIDFNKSKEDLYKIKVKLGRYPSTRELAKINNMLLNSIKIYHHGYRNFLIDLGENVKVPRPRNYWTDTENAKKGMRDVVSDLGHYPTSSELSDIDNGLKTAIFVYFGGLKKFKEIFHTASDTHIRPNLFGTFWKKIENSKNDPQNKENVSMDFRTPPDYFKNLENIKTELDFIKDFLGHFPTSEELRKINRGLLNGITRYHCGYKNLRILLGVKIIQRYTKDLKDLEYVKGEITGIVQNLGHFPKTTELEKIDRGLSHAIYKYHGGYDNLKKVMGFPSFKSLDGFMNFIEKDENLKNIVKIIGNDPVTIADIIAIRYAESYKRKDIVKFFDERPALRDYMGRFATGIRDWEDFQRLADLTLPFDKGEKIKGILIRKGIEYALKDIGHRPSEMEINSKIRELEDRLYKI